MYPINSLDGKPIAIKSKRGRKTLAVSEGHMDATGRTHIMTVRRMNPPVPRKKTTTPRIVKPNLSKINNDCKRCEQSDEYIDALNDRIGKLESLVDKLTNTTEPNYNNNNNNTIRYQSTIPQNQNFASMGTGDLLNLSNQISVVLFERLDMQNRLRSQTSMVTPLNTLSPPFSPQIRIYRTDSCSCFLGDYVRYILRVL